MKKLVVTLVIGVAALGGTTITMQLAGSHHEYVQTHARRGVPMPWRDSLRHHAARGCHVSPSSC